jgi:hypothetical protein
MDASLPPTQGSYLQEELCEIKGKDNNHVTTLVHIFIRFSLISLLQTAERSNTHRDYFLTSIACSDFAGRDALEPALHNRSPAAVTWILKHMTTLAATYYCWACHTTPELLETLWELTRTNMTFNNEEREKFFTWCFENAISTGEMAHVERMIGHLSTLEPAILPWASCLPLQWATKSGYI